MAAVGKLSIRCVFADETKTTINVDNINPQTGINIETVRQTIKNFNNSKGGNLAPKMKSKNGFNWIGIDQATYTVTDREYIF